ncbi:S-methyl-5'-thioadenosine phosphorylase, partial [Fragariocoptes setiger]
MAGSKVIVGILGGTGLDQDSSILSDKTIIELQETPYGRASDTQAISGVIEGVKVYILARHGKSHDRSPSHVNYRANLWTLVQQLNCTHILVTSACGSLQEHIEPGHAGILDQYIDRTTSFRDRSFFKVCHIAQGRPINACMRDILIESCQEAQVNFHKDLCAVTIEGPRFSTLAESLLHKSWGCHVVNMTSVPEVQLAAELGVFYGCLLLITDYDCWKEGEECVSAEMVTDRMKSLRSTAVKIIPRAIKKIAARDWSAETLKMKKSVKEAMMNP